MKKLVAGIATSLLIGAAVNANAALIQVDFTSAGDWYYEDLEANTSALDELPALHGSFILDNSRADIGAISNIDIYANDNHLTALEPTYGYDGDVFHYDDAGYLENFEYVLFSNAASMWEGGVGFDSYSFAEVMISEGWTYCNGTCISFTQSEVENLPPATNVPEPATLALFGIGSLGLAFARRRQKTNLK